MCNSNPVPSAQCFSTAGFSVIRKNINVDKKQTNDNKWNTAAKNHDFTISDFVNCDNDGFVGHRRNMLCNK
jgi:surface antigen